MQLWDQLEVERRRKFMQYMMACDIPCLSLANLSLLDILAGRKDRSGLTGNVLVNGEHQPNNFKCISGYVVQVRL